MPRSVLLAVAVAALGALSPPDARATSCAPTLTWRGVTYHGGFGARGVDIGKRVGTGLIPDCPNPGEDARPPAPVAVRRVADVRPAIAVGVRRLEDLYLAEGYVPESRRHPLHRVLFRRGSPVESAGWSCGKRFRRNGRVVTAPPNAFRVDFARAPGAARFFLDARTLFRGLDRHGVPYVPRGTRVTLAATRCTRPDGRSKLVVRSLAARGSPPLAG